MFGLAACGGTNPGNVSFAGDVQPIFDAKCTACHPTAYPALDLRAGRSYDELLQVSPPNAPSYQRVVPGAPGLSYLLLHPPDPSRRTLLTAAERRLIADWIRQGAKND
jgi:uncharacterized membrane protein